MKVIELTKGQAAIVDDGDFEHLAQWRWSYAKGYAVRMQRVNGNPFCIRMHREIMSTPDGMQVDHINGNGLDNRRCNLRNCTIAQNHWNKRAQKNNRTGLKGVCKDKKSGKFVAYVSRNGRNMYLGSFTSAEEAKSVRDFAAEKMHGEFFKS